jgi:hypothetical protein
MSGLVGGARDLAVCSVTVLISCGLCYPKRLTAIEGYAVVVTSSICVKRMVRCVEGRVRARGRLEGVDQVECFRGCSVARTTLCLVCFRITSNISSRSILCSRVVKHWNRGCEFLSGRRTSQSSGWNTCSVFGRSWVQVSARRPVMSEGCVISGFHRGVNEVSAPLGCYAV